MKIQIDEGMGSGSVPLRTSVSEAPEENGSRNALPASPWLTEMREHVESHPAVNHLLLSRLATGPYTRMDYMAFGLQHFALVGFFTKYMELLLIQAPSSAEKLWLAKVLIDEYGEGSEGRDHSELYLSYLRSAGVPTGVELETELCPEVWMFVGEHLRICREEPFLVGLGALGPGHEWAIPKMFAHIIPGLRRAGFRSDERLYFDLHTEQDIDHGSWMEELLEEQATTPEQIRLVQRGALQSLAARFRFWTGVERQIVAGRQPVSVEAVRSGLHGPSRRPVDNRSPGTLADLRRSVDAFLGGAPWPIALPAPTPEAEL